MEVVNITIKMQAPFQISKCIHVQIKNTKVDEAYQYYLYLFMFTVCGFGAPRTFGVDKSACQIFRLKQHF